MAKLIGGVTLEDEGTHPATDDQYFSENMLFTFFADDGSHGGLVRIGNRVNEGYAEVTFLIFLPDGRALFRFHRPQIQGNEGFNAAGMEFVVVEPSEKVVTRYSGEAFLLEKPGLLSDPKHAFTTSPTVDVEFDVVHRGLSAMFMPMPNHYEQHMHVTGTLRYGSETLAIDAKGVRDHTWDRRHWQATYCDRTIWWTVSDQFGLTLSLTWHDEKEPPEVMGYIADAEKIVEIKEARITSSYLEDNLTHTGFQLQLKLEDERELNIDADVSAVAPLRHRKDGAMTYIGQGMTRFRMGDVVGWGLSEYMDLVVDGRRVISDA